MLMMGPSLYGLRRLVPLATAALLLLASHGAAKTRWSSLHMVPDADMLSGGEFTVEGFGLFATDSAGKGSVVGTGALRLGIIEWVNIYAGYADGATLGFKARILGETHLLLPSLSIGINNLLNHSELYLFDAQVVDKKSYTNELFLALGKSAEPLRLRFHGGIQSIPALESEVLNWYIAAEKYFGNGLYIGFEGFTRNKLFHPCLFANYRFLKNRVQVSAGLIELRHMLFDDRGRFAVSLNKPAQQDGFVRPGIWFGLTVRGNLGSGKPGGFTGLEDRLTTQQKTIEKLSSELEVLKKNNERQERLLKQIESGAGSSPSAGSATLTVSTYNDNLDPIILDKLIKLKAIHTTQPFEPEKAQALGREITEYRQRAVPVLKALIANTKEDRLLRVLCIGLLGESGDKSSSDVLLEVLGRAGDPDIRIEALIALGKMKETRAVHFMEQMANDPHDGVAFAAQEVLMQLVRETGVTTSEAFAKRSVNMPDSVSLKEQSLVVDSQSVQKISAPPSGPVTVTTAPAADSTASTIAPKPTITPPAAAADSSGDFSAALPDSATAPPKKAPPVPDPAPQKKSRRRSEKP
jgi:hypothetical protein